MEKSLFKTHLPLLIAAFVFLLAAFYDFYFFYLWWGFVHLSITFANIFVLKYFRKYPELTTVFLGILNAVISFTTAWLFTDVGEGSFQVFWILIGVASLYISFRFLSLAQKKYL